MKNVLKNWLKVIAVLALLLVSLISIDVAFGLMSTPDTFCFIVGLIILCLVGLLITTMFYILNILKQKDNKNCDKENI